MLQSKPSLSWPLRLIAALSLIGPASIFAYSAWSNRADIDQRTDMRLERSLDIIQEHALKVLQTIDRTLVETNEVLRGLTDEEIRADEQRLSMRLLRTQEALPQMQAIWAFDRDGHPLVSSTVLPVPRELDNSDRDYFRAHVAGEVGTYIGDIVQARIGTLRFFVMSARRPLGPDGRFNGVIGITVLPEHFREFYARLASQGVTRNVADSFGLIRADGAFLARFPRILDRPERLNEQSMFVRSVRQSPETGVFTATSQVDGIERRIGYRRVPGYPVYVQTGIETAAMWRELRDILIAQLAFGLPAALALFALSIYALRRTQRFQAEVIRREVAEAALKQAQRLEAVGQLTGGVAHDFNNLLMVVHGSVERLKRYPVADERQRRALDAIETAAKRGASLTRQLLSFSRRQVHEPATVDLRRHLPDLEEMLRSSLRGNIAVETHVPDDIWPIKVDQSEFELAILNLAVNARDAMPNGGQLTLAGQNVSLADAGTIGLRGDYVALSMTDTGGGIPPDVLARVFEPFFTTKEVGMGTGLGLSQVYGFAQQSGGTATIASQPGRGTTVTMYLPRTTESVAPNLPERPHPADPSASPGQRGHVLLVEDNADVAEITRARLEELGYRVTQARDAAAALAYLKGHAGTIDLVFSDILMPGDLNGLDLARQARRLLGERVPVLLATGYSDVAQAATREGFPLLSKPYETSEMREAIAKALRTARLRAVTERDASDNARQGA